IEMALQKNGDEIFRKRFHTLTLDENSWLRGSPVIIRSKLRNLRSLHYDLKKTSFTWTLNLYYYYVLKDEQCYSDIKRLYLLKEQAEIVIAQQNAAALLTIVNYMAALLIEDEKKNNAPDIIGTGIA
ncbi:MAG: hypothetical protein LBT50_07465, partial [Prevotellaceae bacterium]|nr:hypothetical protein [Prevotellaceae bacterium]